MHFALHFTLHLHSICIALQYYLSWKLHYTTYIYLFIYYCMYLPCSVHLSEIGHLMYHGLTYNHRYNIIIVLVSICHDYDLICHYLVSICVSDTTLHDFNIMTITFSLSQSSGKRAHPKVGHEKTCSGAILWCMVSHAPSFAEIPVAQGKPLTRRGEVPIRQSGGRTRAD